MGLTTQDYTTDKVDIAALYSGCPELWVQADQMDRVRGMGALPLAWLAAQIGQLPSLLAYEGVTPCWARPAPARP